MAVAGRQFVMLDSELRRSATAEWRWRMALKFHLFVHLTEMNTSPRETWNYADEGEIGKCADFAERCHPRTQKTAIIGKYKLFLKW